MRKLDTCRGCKCRIFTTRRPDARGRTGRPAPFPRYPLPARLFFCDLGQQPGLNGGGRLLLLRMIIGEMARFEDYRAQLGDAVTTRVVEVDKRKARPGHRILQERDRR